MRKKDQRTLFYIEYFQKSLEYIIFKETLHFDFFRLVKPLNKDDRDWRKLQKALNEQDYLQVHFHWSNVQLTKRIA